MEDSQLGWKQIAVTALIGAIYSIGCALQAPVTPWRVAIGRAICGSALTASAGLIYTLYPTAPPGLIYPAAAGLAVIGTAGLERIVGRVWGGGKSEA